MDILEDCVAANPADKEAGQREADRYALPLVEHPMVPRGSVYVILPSLLKDPDLSEFMINSVRPVDIKPGFDVNRVMARRYCVPSSGGGIV